MQGLFDLIVTQLRLPIIPGNALDIDKCTSFYSHILFYIFMELQNNPPDLSQCVFVIEQALSVRALQELVTAAGSESVR